MILDAEDDIDVVGETSDGIEAIAESGASARTLLAPSITRRVIEEFVQRPPDSADAAAEVCTT